MPLLPDEQPTTPDPKAWLNRIKMDLLNMSPEEQSILAGSIDCEEDFSSAWSSRLWSGIAQTNMYSCLLENQWHYALSYIRLW
jgi:hypothetical protein